jgi:hypothetical protein
MKAFIVKEGFGIVVLTILLIPQIAHTVYVFNLNSQYRDPWFGWFYAVGVDSAVLIFTVKGWRKTAIVYLVGTFAHNVVYQFWPESIASSLLICVMLSATIYCFSHLFYSRPEKKIDIEKSPREKEAMLLAEAKANGILIVALPFQCPECKEGFPNAKKLNGHISGHKSKNQWRSEKYAGWEKQNSERATLLENLTLASYS